MDNTLTRLTFVEKEMGYSLQEFIQQFKLFAKQLDYQYTQNEFIITNENNTVTIKLNVKSNRKIASLLISCLLVTFTFENYTQAEQTEFLKKFDLSFQRGGG